MVLRRDVCWVHQSYLKWDKVANLANKMLENHGIAEGHVLGPVIFKMCTVDFFVHMVLLWIQPNGNFLWSGKTSLIKFGSIDTKIEPFLSNWLLIELHLSIYASLTWTNKWIWLKMDDLYLFLLFTLSGKSLRYFELISWLGSKNLDQRPHNWTGCVQIVKTNKTKTIHFLITVSKIDTG